LLLAAEQLSVIDRVLREDVSYLIDREAFGRKVGSFQAVKHQLAQIYCRWEQGVALLDHALTVFGDPAVRTTAVDTVQCFVAPAAVQATTDALRLLGGIGFTWEHDAHLYFRRARAAESMLENIHVRRSRLAGALGLRTTTTGSPA
jgi:alkylation response protein AidB-like acyl-CoA dehydrogenase